MAKRIQRSEPPYIQIARHYQRMIRDGTLAEGDRLPPVRRLAEEWGVVRATANRAVQYLEAAQLVEATRAGTLVKRRRAVPAPRDRVITALRRQRLSAEHVKVVQAGLVTRAYVAKILGMDAHDPVVRREQVTYRAGEPITLSVYWLPGTFAEPAPELLETRALDTLEVAHERLGRLPTVGDDGVSARPADAREASALGIPAGTSILAGVWTCSDDQGLIEYGEYVAPPEHVVTYRYRVLPEEEEEHQP